MYWLVRIIELIFGFVGRAIEEGGRRIQEHNENVRIVRENFLNGLIDEDERIRRLKENFFDLEDGVQKGELAELEPYEVDRLYETMKDTLQDVKMRLDDINLAISEMEKISPSRDPQIQMMNSKQQALAENIRSNCIWLKEKYEELILIVGQRV